MGGGPPQHCESSGASMIEESRIGSNLLKLYDSHARI